LPQNYLFDFKQSLVYYSVNGKECDAEIGEEGGNVGAAGTRL
jgi:hypothetical protein